ncbi:hypothetical protein KC19_1G203900 [Ceratodon purpureus]|uniref:Secreted protein n=1 Tax=Ceratodon purpureus TaxID=3225 RepID=A0A8T0J7D5_CERPU|nr:hypothetical protein KC19_1G203900 [Ceratodon purpureus]
MCRTLTLQGSGGVGIHTWMMLVLLLVPCSVRSACAGRLESDCTIAAVAAVGTRGGCAMESERMSNGGESKVNGADHTASFSSSNGADFPAEFTFVPRPMEPNDLDRPVRCPPPEPCIVHDGIVFKDRLANSRRRSDLLGSMRENDHIEYYSTPPNRRRNRSSKELLQSPALIAPDLVATKIVD